jgi:dihydropyrimidinase
VEEEGIPSFKVYMAYKGAVGLDDKHLIRVMDTAAKLGARIMIHCEHDEVIRYLQEKFTAEGKTAPKYHPLSRPPEAEREAVIRALMMAKQTGCPLYIVHISTSGALSETTKAQLEQQDVKVETCPHYLLLQENEYHRPGFEGAAYVMSPPLRTKRDSNSLWKEIRNGHIQVTATDHCPFHMKNGKDRGMENFSKIPNGVAGVENRMGLLYTYGVLRKRISLNRWAAVTSTLPAKIFGLYPRKGAIVPGADADLILWDPRAKGTISADTHFQNCDTNIYEGFSVKGKPRVVILNGKIAFQEGSVKAERNSGCYLYRGIKRS